MTKVYFLDSTALVQRYVEEKGTDWIKNNIDDDPDKLLYISRVAWIEVLSAIVNRQREHDFDKRDIEEIQRAFNHHLNTEYHVINVNQAVAETAEKLVDRYQLKAYAAIQLASALQLIKPYAQTTAIQLIFVTMDSHLYPVAEDIAEGIANKDIAKDIVKDIKDIKIKLEAVDLDVELGEK